MAAMFAMRDLCPHRGIPLSAGWFDGETVQCKYHGWRFEPCSGQCEEIPSLTPIDHAGCDEDLCDGVSVRGAGWVCVGVCAGGGGGAGEDASALPPVPELPKFRRAVSEAHLTAELPCNVDHGIIGLMDPAHGPFVHQAWWWRSAASIHEKTKHFEPYPDRRTERFRMVAHAPSANTAPYKLLGEAGDDDRLCAAEPAV